MGWEVALLAASTALSVDQSIQQAKSQKAMYKLQGLQAQAEGERKALQYEQRANDTLRNLRRSLSANMASRFAGGVSGLDGSAKLIDQISTQEAARDMMFDVSNAKNAILGGQTQADIYDVSGSIAQQSGLLDAGVKLGEAAYKYYQVSAEPTATPKAATPTYNKPYPSMLES